MKIYGRTDIGKMRETNQDTFAYGDPIHQGCFAIVCDGMGGQNGGNVASQIARDQLMEVLIRQLRQDLDENAVRNLLLSGFTVANQMVYEKSLSDSNLRGMGTTAIVAVILNDRLYAAHVGDSRAYLLAGGILSRLTQDHSVVEMLLKSGQISPEEAREHPRRNQITRAVGVLPDITMDFVTEAFRPGDKLMLCSDGLTVSCKDEEIQQILNTNDVKQGVERLITLANTCGGTDNVTVVIIENNE